MLYLYGTPPLLDFTKIIIKITYRIQLVCTLVCLMCGAEAYAQDWHSISTGLSPEQNEGVDIVLYEGNQYHTGYFKSSLSIGFWSVSGSDFDDIYFAKAGLDGNIKWFQSIKGTGIDRPTKLLAFDDKIAIAGYFTDSLFFPSDTLINNYQTGVFLAFYDTLGNYLSVVQPEVYNARLTDFELDSQNNLIITGMFYQFFNYGGFSMNVITGLNFFLLKYDMVQDSVIWGVNAHGSVSESRGLSIDANDNIYVVALHNDGTTLIDTTFNNSSGYHNFFVGKFDADGNKIWSKTIEGSAEVHGYGIVADDSGNFFVAGEFEGDITLQGGGSHSSNGFYDILFAKYDTDGNVLWSESIGGTNSDEGYDLVLDDNQDPILMADFGGAGTDYRGEVIPINGWTEPLLIKVNSNTGDLIWYKTIDATATTGIVNGKSISYEGDYIGITGINRSSILFNSVPYAAPNQKDFYTMILSDSLTYYVGIDDLSANEINVFPNPVSTNINVESDKFIDQLNIYSVKGQLIKSFNVNNMNTKLDLSIIPNGVYLLECVSPHFTTTKRIIKQ